MTTKFTHTIFILVAVLAFAACSLADDFLNEKPSKSSTLVPTSIDHLEYLLNAYSSYYQEGDRAHFFSSDDFGVLTSLVDIRLATYGVAAAQFACWDIEYLPRDGRESFWSGEYGKIFRANMVLHYLPKVSGPDDQKQALEYEAKFIRAYSLWRLAQTYCLPYTEANKNEPGLPLKRTTAFDEPAARATLEETYAMIEEDLTEALKLQKEMPIVNNKYKQWRASKAAVNAFAARYYLNRSNYAKAMEHANTALSLHSDMMDYNVDMRYSDIITNVNVGGVPTRQWFPYTHDNQSVPTDMMEWKDLYYYRVLYHESWWYLPSPELLAIYDQDYDLRYKYHMVKNYSYYFLANPAYEYPGYIFWFKDKIPSGPTVGEMHLIRAECLARNNDFTGAMTALNTLRAKRMDNTAPSNRIHLTAATRAEALNHIFDERRREMPFVLRWWDVRRLNTNEDPLDDIGDLTRTFYTYNNATVVTTGGIKTYTLPKASRRYAAPLWQQEIESSQGAIEQNKY